MLLVLFSLEPTPTKTLMPTERAWGIVLVTTRIPLSRVVFRNDVPPPSGEIMRRF